MKQGEVYTNKKTGELVEILDLIELYGLENFQVHYQTLEYPVPTEEVIDIEIFDNFFEYVGNINETFQSKLPKRNRNRNTKQKNKKP